MDSPSTPNRVPISHPYPPSYRSHMTSSPHYTSPSPSVTYAVAASPTSSRAPAYGSPAAVKTNYDLNYQRRRDERHLSQGAPPAGPSIQQDQASNPFRNPSGYNISQDQLNPTPGYTAVDHNNPYSASNSPNPESRMMGRDRSVSESSLHPLKLEAGSGGGGAGNGAGEYPTGWTAEDEAAEKEFLKQGMFDWQNMKSWRFWIRKEWWFYYVLAILLGVLVSLMAIYHDQIVNWLKPVTNWMKNLPAGWVIPIVILFVISFPPLFGHEIVGILVGAVWGLWIGFGIVAAGTLAGEIGNFYAFKYLLRKRAEKYEKENLNYACMAHVVRDGGFFIIFVARLSAIPGHFTTAVFSTCGMNIFIFTLACLLTMPKQLLVVYLGVIFEQGDRDSKSKIISDSVLAVGFLVTIWAAWYIYRKMNQARVVVWRQQRMESKATNDVEGKMTTEETPGPRHQQRFSLKEWPIQHNNEQQTEEEQEMISPMINSDQRHLSYQALYHIKYQPADNMSVYEVDGPLQPRPEMERDIGYNNPNFTPYSSTEAFPEAHPSQAATVNRQPTTSTIYPQSASTMRTPSPAVFPTPHPVEGGMDNYSISDPRIVDGRSRGQGAYPDHPGGEMGNRGNQDHMRYQQMNR